MGRFENKWIACCRILFSSDLNLTQITNQGFVQFPLSPKLSKGTQGKEVDPAIWIFLPFMYHRSVGRFFSPARSFFPVFSVSQELGIENLSQRKVWLVGIHCFLIWYIAVSNIGELGEGTEREGFEPSVNKSLHSSSNATPWTTRPSLLHNDYDREYEWIASCSDSIVRWVQTIESILTIKIENFSSKKEFFLRAWEKKRVFFVKNC